jgi:hypothetical protein
MPAALAYPMAALAEIAGAGMCLGGAAEICVAPRVV